VALLALLLSGSGRLAAEGDGKMGIAFTLSMFAGLNQNDARASIRMFADTIARERNIPANPDPLLLSGCDEIEQVVNSGRANAISMTMAELWNLREKALFDSYLATSLEGNLGENYLLLVRTDSPYRTLGDLKGVQLMLLSNWRHSLARIWLDVILAKQGLAQPDGFFGQIVKTIKPAKAVLPVFFKKRDACVISERVFKTMVELNPQIGKQLRVIARSPAYVPALFAFSTSYPPQWKERVMKEFSGLADTLTGRQVLMIFQAGQVVPLSQEPIDEAFALLDDHARICPEANAALRVLLRSGDGISKEEP
jgi:phosphonate transport system substrate-binding protein